MKIKKIIITGNEKELEFINRILCGVINLTEISSYQNYKNEGLLFLNTRVDEIPNSPSVSANTT